MNKPVILVVEDEALIAANVVKTLTSLGYVVHEPVATGEDAIRAVKNQKPDLVLMDIELLEEMDGIEAAEKIRAIADIPIVYLTAYTDDLRLKKAQLTEPYGYIVKPAHSRELHATIEMALYKHGIDRKLKESEEKFRAIFGAESDGIFIIDKESGIIIDCNDAVTPMYGYRKDEVVGQSNTVMSAEPDATRAATQKIEKFIPVRYHKRKDGRVFTVEITASVVPVKGRDVIVAAVRDITERKRVEEELQASETRFRLLFNSQRDAVAVHKIGKDGQPTTFIQVNDVTSERLGYTREEMLRLRPQDIDSPDNAGQMPAIIEKLLKNKYVLFETEHISKDGRRIPVEVSTVLFQLDDDLATMSVARDLSKRKLAEEALRESEARFKKLFVEAPMGIALIDSLTGHIYNVNPMFASIAGRTMEEMVQIDWMSITHPDDVQADLDNMALLNAGKITGFQMEKRYLHHDGAFVWINMTIAPVIVEDKTHPRHLCMIEDITERKRVEEALHESEERYRVVADFTSDWEYWIAPDGKFIYISPSSERITGFRPEEFVLDPNLLFTITHTNDRQKIIDHLSLVRNRDNAHGTIEFRITTRNGEERWIGHNCQPVHNANGEFLGRRGSNRDITERKVAEEALHQANKKLTLLSSITRHDINNQLTVLMGYLAIMEKKQTDPTFNNYFGQVSTAAQRISSMIKFTKEYDSIGVNVPVWQDCRRVVDTAAKQAPLGNVVVKNDLPAGTEVFADPLIGKVFYNLMDNAARYGGKITTIRFSAEEHDGDHVVVCEDDGDGVVAEEKEKIFERGFGKNTGLGLALAREILDITGITIRETGEPGKGARFEMMVPKGAWRITDVQKEL